MHVALTVWENRISPVFDAANRLLIAEIKECRVCDRRYMAFNPDALGSTIDTLSKAGITVLICGAISEFPACRIEMAGIRLIPFIAGMIEEVLGSFAGTQGVGKEFLMPGCGCVRCRRGAGRRRGKRNKPETTGGKYDAKI